jgi:glycerophosphoryl diester phosphodiesterase
VGERARPLVVAHRTCPELAPENSLLGIRRAAELGADVVEVDVRLSVEGRPVLLHDRTLRRTTGTIGPPYLRRERAITALEIGDGEHVPTFAGALDALPEGLRMAVEIKVPRAIHPVLAAVVEREAQDRVLIWAHQPSVVRFVADRHPTIEASLQADLRSARARRGLRTTLTRSRAAGLSTRIGAVTPDLVDEVRALGLRLYARCGPSELTSERIAPLDGVVTDRPEAARAVVDAA